MKIKEYTARDLAAMVQASTQKTQKAYFCSEYSNPIVILEGNSFKTGKHGSSKTRLFCSDYFKSQKVSLLVQSDMLFVEMNDAPGYKEQEIILLQKTKTGLKYMNLQYETHQITLSEEEKDKYNIEEESNYILQQFETSSEIFKKIKSKI